MPTPLSRLPDRWWLFLLLLGLAVCPPSRAGLITYNVVVSAGDSFAYDPGGSLLSPGHLELGWFTSGSPDASNAANLHGTDWNALGSTSLFADGEFLATMNFDNTGIVGEQLHLWLFDSDPAGDYASNIGLHGLYTSSDLDWLVPATNTSPTIAGSDVNSALLGSFTAGTPNGFGGFSPEGRLTLSAVPEPSGLLLSLLLATLITFNRRRRV